GEGPTPRTESDYAALRSYAEQLDADVVALQEIDGPEAARRVFDPKVYDFHFSSRAHTQLVGFAYKKTLRVTHNPDLVALARVNSERLRYGVDLTVHTKGHSMRLLAVHLKSGCFESPLDGPYRDRERPDACKKLKRQVPVLERWIEARAKEEVPFAVLGDFNRRFAKQDEVWRRLNDKEAHGVGLHTETMHHRSECMQGRYPRYIDHLVFDDRAWAKVDPKSFAQLVFRNEDERKYGRRLSDHCPVSMVVR
ncbi:MAG: endonuclease/exonuclease/phosphatase family protein, partial [Myxococcota bacterium]